MRLLCSVKLCYKAIKNKISVSTDFLLFFAVAVVVLPIQWLGAWMLAIFIHELCHFLTLQFCGVSVNTMQISCQGVTMYTESISLGKEALCAYAGPIGALIILLFARHLPRTAICTLVFSAYNLLPVFPLDGGRGLGCLLMKLLPERTAKKFMRYVENLVLMGVSILALYAVFVLGLGLLPAMFIVLLLIRCTGIKIPCKKGRLGLQ